MSAIAAGLAKLRRPAAPGYAALAITASSARRRAVPTLHFQSNSTLVLHYIGSENLGFFSPTTCCNAAVAKRYRLEP